MRSPEQLLEDGARKFEDWSGKRRESASLKGSDAVLARKNDSLERRGLAPVPVEARTVDRNPDQFEEALTAQEFTRRAAGLPSADQEATAGSHGERAFGTYTGREDRASSVVARMQRQRRASHGGGWNPNRDAA